MIPDAVQTTIGWLRAHPDITALTATVAGDLVGYSAGDRWVVVSTSGGTSILPFRLDGVAVDINAYAETRPMARRLCAEVVGAMWEMRNHTTADAVVTAIEVATSPTDLTDLIDNAYRFIAGVTVYIRPR